MSAHGHGLGVHDKIAWAYYDLWINFDVDAACAYLKHVHQENDGTIFQFFPPSLYNPYKDHPDPAMCDCYEQFKASPNLNVRLKVARALHEVKGDDKMLQLFCDQLKDSSVDCPTKAIMLKHEYSLISDCGIGYYKIRCEGMNLSDFENR